MTELIVSEHDLLASLDQGQKWSAHLAKYMMSGNLYSARPETSVATLVQVLRASDLIGVPVVDVAEKLIGIVARRDILRAYLNEGLIANAS